MREEKHNIIEKRDNIRYTMAINSFYSIFRATRGTFREISRVTEISGIFFILIILSLNIFANTSSGAELIRDEVWSKGGPVENPEDSVVISGLPVEYQTLQEEKVIQNDASGSVTSVSLPLTNASTMRDGIIKYKVRKGETIQNLASRFGISVETIQSANQSIKRAVKQGDVLTILPVSGILYEINEGDTIELLAQKFQVSEDLIKRYNPQYTKIIMDGQGTLLLPYATISSAFPYKNESQALPDLKGFFSLPAQGWNWGELHTENAVDIANKCGTAVFASADGLVVKDAELGNGKSGWNKGYGTFVLIEHANGTKTRYAHLDEYMVDIGDTVTRGTQVGTMGNSGNTDGPSGCHLHFEVLGARNPFVIK